MAAAQAKEPGGYDNSHPRLQQVKLTGVGARASAAHLNGFESFPMFAAAVIMANAAHVDVTMINRLAIAHVAFRCLYNVVYLANIAAVRTIVWGAAAGAGIWLMILAILAT